MWETTAESHTDAPPSAVWALWCDAGRWRDWNEQIVSAELLRPFEQGATARVHFKRFPRALRFTITQLEDGRAFTDETRLPGARLGHEHRVDRIDGRTRIFHRLYFDGPAERVWALVMGRQMQIAVHRFGELEHELAARGADGAAAAESGGRPPSTTDS